MYPTSLSMDGNAIVMEATLIMSSMVAKEMTASSRPFDLRSLWYHGIFFAGSPVVATVSFAEATVIISEWAMRRSPKDVRNEKGRSSG